MARVTYVSIPAGYESVLARGLRFGDRFVFPRIVRKNRFISYPKRQALKQRSLLPQVGALWKNLSTADRNLWIEAATYSSMTGYRLFVQDTCERIKLSLSGLATPSIYHQCFVGQLHVESPATEIKLIQPHPRVYWTRHKKKGTKDQYTYTQITEDFALPLQIGISYKSNLTSTGANPFCRFYARVRSLYQGRNIYTHLIIEIPLTSGWTTTTETLSSVIGLAISYDLFLEISDAEGDVWVDNVISNHSGQNWARDPRCNNIKTGFTSVWYLVPKNWAPVTLPTGADYGSIYTDN